MKPHLDINVSSDRNGKELDAIAEFPGKFDVLFTDIRDTFPVNIVQMDLFPIASERRIASLWAASIPSMS